LKRLERQARRRFGQHFLVDASITGRIARLAGSGEGVRVIEVGPGLGALSRALLETGCTLRAVELDRDLVAFLAQDLPQLDVISADAMEVDWAQVAPGEGWVLCANLPFNVGTAILTRLVTMTPRFQKLVVMLQREVAMRVVAQVGDKARGSLSVHVQAYGHPRLALTVEPGSFHPRPKVRSSVIEVLLHDPPRLGGVTPKFFQRVVRAGFSQRRKTLENALGSVFDRNLTRQVVPAVVGAQRRAQTLTVDEWGELAAAIRKAQC
jgi:16S rRNA (adenine1518-N6/adenine1519-N6)-dimethyltransferase